MYEKIFCELLTPVKYPIRLKLSCTKCIIAERKQMLT